MPKVSSAKAPVQSAAPNSDTDIFPAPTSTGRESAGMEIWSCIDREITMSLSVANDDDAPFISANVCRPTDDVLRIQMRSSSKTEPRTEDFGLFYVPMPLVPYLGAYFTAMVARAKSAGLLRPGTFNVYQDIETITLPTLDAPLKKG